MAHEVAILGQLDHPSIVRFLGLCRRGGWRDDVYDAFIVQEWCAGNLRSVIDCVHRPTLATLADTTGGSATSGTEYSSQKRYHHRQLFLFARQLAQGMIYLHERGIVHRDLKPENVLLSVGARPHVRICDFGVSEASMRRAHAQARLRLQKKKNGSAHHRPVPSLGRAAGAQFTSPKPPDHHHQHHAGSICNVCGCTSAECSCIRDDDSEVNADFPGAESHLPPLQALGTIEYMAPEVFACYAMDADCRGRMNMPIDVYAFGVMLWELMRAPLDDGGLANGNGNGSDVREDDFLKSKRSTSAPRLLAGGSHRPNLDGVSDGTHTTPIGHTTKAVTLGGVQRLDSSDGDGNAVVVGSIDCAPDGTRMRQVLELGSAFHGSDWEQRVPRLDALRQATWPRFVREVDDPTGPPPVPMDSDAVEVRVHFLCEWLCTKATSVFAHH